MKTQYSATSNMEHFSIINRTLAHSNTCAKFALATFVWLSVYIGMPEKLSAQSTVLAHITAEKEHPQSSALKRPSAQTHEEIKYAEELQYVRLSDLIGEGNTQYTYTPAKYDPNELRRHLRQTWNTLPLSGTGSVDVVVYLNAEGKITHLNYIGEESEAHTTLAKSACNAVRRCTFLPAYRNNKPVHSVVVIPVKFVF